MIFETVINGTKLILKCKPKYGYGIGKTEHIPTTYNIFVDKVNRND